MNLGIQTAKKLLDGDATEGTWQKYFSKLLDCKVSGGKKQLEDYVQEFNMRRKVKLELPEGPWEGSKPWPMKNDDHRWTDYIEKAKADLEKKN